MKLWKIELKATKEHNVYTETEDEALTLIKQFCKQTEKVKSDKGIFEEVYDTRCTFDVEYGAWRIRTKEITYLYFCEETMSEAYKTAICKLKDMNCGRQHPWQIYDIPKLVHDYDKPNTPYNW